MATDENGTAVNGKAKKPRPPKPTNTPIRGEVDAEGRVWFAVPEKPDTGAQADATQPSPSDPNLFSLKDDVTLAAIAQAISVARVNRPTIHGEKQRRYAIVLTQLEQVYAYCKTFVVNAENI